MPHNYFINTKIHSFLLYQINLQYIISNFRHLFEKKKSTLFNEHYGYFSNIKNQDKQLDCISIRILDLN